VGRRARLDRCGKSRPHREYSNKTHLQFVKKIINVHLSNTRIIAQLITLRTDQTILHFLKVSVLLIGCDSDSDCTASEID
jgi:ribosomal protein L18